MLHLHMTYSSSRTRILIKSKNKKQKQNRNQFPGCAVSFLLPLTLISFTGLPAVAVKA